MEVKRGEGKSVLRIRRELKHTIGIASMCAFGLLLLLSVEAASAADGNINVTLRDFAGDALNTGEIPYANVGLWNATTGTFIGIASQYFEGNYTFVNGTGFNTDPLEVNWELQPGWLYNVSVNATGFGYNKTDDQSWSKTDDPNYLGTLLISANVTIDVKDFAGAAVGGATVMLLNGSDLTVLAQTTSNSAGQAFFYANATAVDTTNQNFTESQLDDGWKYKVNVSLAGNGTNLTTDFTYDTDVPDNNIHDVLISSNITVNIFYRNGTTAPGITVQLRNVTSDAVFATTTTNSNGVAFFYANATTVDTANQNFTESQLDHGETYKIWMSLYPYYSTTHTYDTATPAIHSLYERAFPAPEFSAIGLLAFIGILSVVLAVATLRKRK